MHWEKNFAKYIFVKGFVYGIYKNYYILLMKTQITQFLFFFFLQKKGMALLEREIKQQYTSRLGSGPSKKQVAQKAQGLNGGKAEFRKWAKDLDEPISKEDK